MGIRFIILDDGPRFQEELVWHDWRYNGESKIHSCSKATTLQEWLTTVCERLMALNSMAIVTLKLCCTEKSVTRKWWKPRCMQNRVSCKWVNARGWQSAYASPLWLVWLHSSLIKTYLHQNQSWTAFDGQAIRRKNPRDSLLIGGSRLHWSIGACFNPCSLRFGKIDCDKWHTWSSYYYYNEKGDRENKKNWKE